MASAGKHVARGLGPLHMSPVDRAGSVSEDLASPHFSLQNVRCVHMRRRVGPVTEISGTELEIFPM